MHLKKIYQISAASLMLLAMVVGGCQLTENADQISDANDAQNTPNSNLPEVKKASLVGDYTTPLNFKNPYSFIPAQCYIETQNGRQNACLFCHNNGLNNLALGNNNPQAGKVPMVNFQLDYGFDPLSTTSPYATKNFWENTFYPEKLSAAVSALNVDPNQWDMAAYVAEDNWSAAYQQRSGLPTDWDSGQAEPFRLLLGLDPQDLPADDDGFVRSSLVKNGYFNDEHGTITGWRAINFMPYGIFTPMTGSVSGIYIRLPKAFMMRETGEFSLAIYQANLDLLEKAITDRLTPTDSATYLGAAATQKVVRGAYPKGTEFAHPLHYVDLDADGINPAHKFGGTRSNRVKEIRWMYKVEDFDPMSSRSGEGEGDAIYGNEQQGWVSNGSGWYLSGFIEDASGQLRPQNREELTQCISCHSGFKNTEFPNFVSGTSSTVDSTWSLARKLPGEMGWKEMNYLGYQKTPEAAVSTTPEPVNRQANQGEFGLMLSYVAGASLYGEMPAAYEAAFAQDILPAKGYSAPWIALDDSSALAYDQSSQQRQTLLREYVAKGDYLTPQQTLKGFLLYPELQVATEQARRYRQVVVTQRFNLGKDVFEKTPLSFVHLRLDGTQEHKTDGTPYQFGEVITERSVQLAEPARFDYRAGDSVTLIKEDLPFEQGGTYFPNYTPLLK